MNSNLTITNGQICSPNLTGNELIFIKRPIIIKKPTNTNNNYNNIQCQTNTNANNAIQNRSMINTSNIEQNYGQSAQDNLLTPQQKQANQFLTDQNKSKHAKYPRESSLHSSGQQRKSFVMVTEKISGVENKEMLNGESQLQYSQVYNVQAHKNIQKQIISQRYLINNVTLSNNVLDANLLIKRPPSASLNQKNKHQITVFQQQQLSFLSSQQQNLSNGLNKKLTINNIQSASGHQSQNQKGNQISYKQKQKITNDNFRKDKNENNFNKKEDIPSYFMDNYNDVRQVVFYKDNNPSYTQRLLKEKNEQQIVVSSKTQDAYQSSRNQNKYLSNSTLRKKDPNLLRESDEFQMQKNFQVNYQSIEKPSILNKTQLTNSYFIDSSVIKSPLMSSQKSKQNLTTSSKQIKTYQLDKLMTNTNHKNQFQQNSLSPYLQPNNIVKNYETNQKNSNSNSPKNSNRLRYLDDSNVHDERDDQSLQLQNSYIEIFSSDLSKFKQIATKLEQSQHPINEQEHQEKSRNSSDSLDSSRKNQQRKHALAVSNMQMNNEQKKNQSAQNQKQKQSKQNKIHEFQKEAKIVIQEPPNKVLSQNQEHRISQLRHKLLEANEKALARKILVKKRSIAKQKSTNLCSVDDKNCSDQEENQQKLECEQPKKTTKSINKQNRITKKGSLKKQDSNIISSTSQVELSHVKSLKVDNEIEAPQQKRKFSENRGTSQKRPPLPLSTNTKKQKEGFEEEDDDFPSLSNLSEIENQYDNLEFEDQEEDENQNDQDQNQEKTISNSMHSSNKDQVGSATELAAKKQIIINKPLPVVTLLKSVYEGRPSTIFFEYPDCCFKKREQGNRTYIANPKEVKKWNLTYRMNDCNRPYQCVTKSFEAGGFVETLSNTQWNGYWASNRISFIKKLNSFQKTNHFAGCWNLGRKDQLWMRVSKQKRKFNEDYDFIPRTMLLGQEWDRFNTLLEDNPETLWIVKPVASCCGKGVHVVQKKCNIAKRKRKHYLASEYISNPHLINDTKYDLRIYVLVTSYDPLRIYMFEDGLVRFATEKYNLTQNGHQRQRFMHLTNYSVNKKSENFVKNNDVNDSGQGSKWSLKSWKEYLIQTIGLEAKEQLLKKMEDVIIKTCIAVEPYMNDSSSKTAQHRNNCFELYGFDILIDNTLKPWLLEVNVCPSLSSSSPLDRKIKTSLISDIFNTLGFIPYDKKKLSQEKKFSNRNQKKKKTRYSVNMNKVIKEEQEQDNVNELLSPRILSNLNTTNTNIQQNVQNSLTISTSAVSNQTTITSGFNFNASASQTNINIEDKKNFSKNIKDIVDLNENNCFQKLSYDDWEILFESDEEKYRCGEFKRIFPSSDLNLVDYYSQFFLFPRYNNIMLWNYLKCSINMLEYVCPKSTTIKC
ncbi:tubulin tyrosine ligase family protein (macronuclear) [Tetrahymena thermophila SB210]|uniref:Tubulin--tyrosine ligase-like protein 5 n=1 Tax=Tetrahymena thermophila (strain SB210) TaxID=312017 RepID=Q23YT1_TETTS|nr:tubulin tyrosine ligase family protein [Tetrahymena thermophila SB210]EAS01724.2 tubulin tyrosine ligase family protein [Tetrahymena thermophila SB210]|eukprot:XP_001021969.2 tubulin tyrosine ligase family protein [Tetrahymena thermophila SB210]